jgi:hypothetical protein
MRSSRPTTWYDYNIGFEGSLEGSCPYLSTGIVAILLLVLLIFTGYYPVRQGPQMQQASSS